ncbi:MAG: host attachment family protein [Actinomycetota bacterium]|nr:host attachment family protein [Actinomycetota bacterium]
MSIQQIDEMRDLIDRETEGPVLSVFCRTDPRDPSSRSETPGWLVALRNGLREAAANFEGDHDSQQQVAKLCKEAESRVTGVSAADRGRSVAYFLSACGEIDSFHTFQIPVRDDYASIEEGAVIWPMVDVLDRGQRTGIVLGSHNHIRVLEWWDGQIRDLEASSYDLELGDWHDYRGAARPNPTRGSAAINNLSAYENRVEEWQARFVKDASKAVAETASDLKFDRLVVAAEGDLCDEFIDALPNGTKDMVQARISTNLIDVPAGEVAEHLDPHLRDAWRAQVNEVGNLALERIRAADRGAGGPDEVLLALTEGRVEHLLIDPYLESKDETLSDGARQAIEDAGEATLQEALVELAIRTDAQVSSASVEEVPALAEADGTLALLRY